MKGIGCFGFYKHHTRDSMNKSKKNELLLYFGTWTSKIGDIVFDYVNSVLLVQTFKSSSWVLAIYQSSQTIVNVLFNLIGGAIADAGKRKRILIITDLLSALVCFITSFFIESRFVAIALIFANAILALIFSFSSPTFRSIIKQMVEKERISHYNSVVTTGNELIGMIAPVFGLVMMNFFDARTALRLNAATFIISAISECLMIELEKDNKNMGDALKRNVLKDIKEGIGYLWKEKKIFFLLLVSAFVNFFLAGYNLLLPYTDLLYADIFSDFYGKVLVAGSIGGVVGSFVNSKLPNKITDKLSVLLFFLGLTGGSLFLPPIVSYTEKIWICLAPFSLFGAMLTMFNINFMTYVQIHVDENYLGRVFSVIFTVAVLFMPVGSFVFSFMNITNNIYGFWIIGGGVVILSIIGYLLIPKKEIE